jgi:MMP 1-O-methyltransferase
MTFEEAWNKAEPVESFVTKDECAVLWHNAIECGKAGRAIVEVGSWKGRSSIVLACAAREAKAQVLFVDTWLHCDIHRTGPQVDYWPEWRSNMGKAGCLDLPFVLSPNDDLYAHGIQAPIDGDGKPDHGALLFVLRFPSVIAARVLTAMLPIKPVGMVFLDADHSATQSRADVIAWGRHIEDGGCLIMHDVAPTGHPGSALVYETLCKRLSHLEPSPNIGVLRVNRKERDTLMT